jgi:hypothetical protein
MQNYKVGKLDNWEFWVPKLQIYKVKKLEN